MKTSDTFAIALNAAENNQLRVIADALPVLISYIDKNYIYRFNNKAYQRWFGYNSNDINGKRVEEVLGHAAFQRIKPKMEQALTGVSTEFEGLVDYKEGGARHIRAQYVPDIKTDGVVAGFFVLVEDITERVHAEEAKVKLHNDLIEAAELLSRERERLGIALRTGGLGVYEWKLGSDTVWWSPETYQLYGVDPKVFAPTVEAFSGLIHPDDHEELWRKTQQSIDEKSVFQHEYRIKRGDGQWRWILNRSHVGLDTHGNVERITGIAADITERKSVQSELENLVNERTKELQRSNSDLQQFAHVTSHDLKEPVRKIKLFTGRLEDALGDSANEKARLYLSKIQHASERITAIIEGVLGYSMISHANAQFEKVDLRKLVNDIEQDLEVLIEEKQVLIRHRDLPEIEGSFVLLYQLFYNLIHNSIKFARAGVQPEVVLAASDIQVSGERYVRIQVRDNGIGFEASHAQSIFDIFKRLNSKDLYEGTGLGLSLARKITERHRGSIKADGVPGEGATFTIELPYQSVGEKQTDKSS